MAAIFSLPVGQAQKLRGQPLSAIADIFREKGCGPGHVVGLRNGEDVQRKSLSDVPETAVFQGHVLSRDHLTIMGVKICELRTRKIALFSVPHKT